MVWRGRVAGLQTAALAAGSAAFIGPLDIFLVAGQSNSHWGETLDAGTDIGHASLLQWTQAGAFASSAEPLDHADRQATKIGYAVAFARDYYIPNALLGGRGVLLVPRAQGSTGFSNNKWNSGDVNYEAAEAATVAAVAARASPSLKAVLFNGGETDAQDSSSAATFRTALEAMITALRTDLSSANLPIVLGGMSGFVVGNDPLFPTGSSIDYVLRNCVNRVNYTGYFNSADLALADTHFTAAEQRTRAGRCWTAYQAALANVISWSNTFVEPFNNNGGGTIHGYSLRQTIPAAAISASGSRIRVTFKAPAGAAAGFKSASIVERSGASDDGTTTPTQIFFNNFSASVSIAAGGTALSDPLTFAIDETKSYLIIMDLSDTEGNLLYNTTDPAAGSTGYFKAATVSYNQQTVSGFTEVGGDINYFVSKIEVSS